MHPRLPILALVLALGTAPGCDRGKSIDEEFVDTGLAGPTDADEDG